MTLTGTRCPGSCWPTCAAILGSNSQCGDSHRRCPATWLGSAPAHGAHGGSPVRASAVPWQAVSRLCGFPRFAETERLGVRSGRDSGLVFGRGCCWPMCLAVTRYRQRWVTAQCGAGYGDNALCNLVICLQQNRYILKFYFFLNFLGLLLLPALWTSPGFYFRRKDPTFPLLSNLLELCAH